MNLFQNKKNSSNNIWLPTKLGQIKISIINIKGQNENIK